MSLPPNQPTIAPYGAWASPITAQSLAASEVRLDELRVANGRLYWTESRPDQGGRQVIVTQKEGVGVQDITPEGFNVRTRVHEYGGAPFTLVGPDVYFSNFADQRLYAQRLHSAQLGEPPAALTPSGARFADGVEAGSHHLICVREDHSDPKTVTNAVVAVSIADGAMTILFQDADFVAYPRLSPDRQRLAFIAWDHPSMPWDTTTLYVGDISFGDGEEVRLVNVRVVAGGEDESVMEPQWDDDGALYFISDRSDFWNLYSWRDGMIQPAYPRDAEFAGPLWTLGQANYALLGGGRAVARYGATGGDRLVVIDLDAGTAREVATPFVGFKDLQRLDSGRVALIATSADETPAVVVVAVDAGGVEIVRRSQTSPPDSALVSHAQPIVFPAVEGTAHAFYYPPVNPDFRAPDGDRPPLILMVHGGPTAACGPALKLGVQYWTSRGFAVIDVNYRGSSGYGRAYRRRLNGQWGVADVQDVVAAVAHLRDAGLVDGDRAAIRGGSAGGFTVLAALSQTDAFNAGASYYGVSDMTALARDTHKFESRYLDGLIGPYPAEQATYDARSPLNHLEGFTAPLIVFQGGDDAVVPPNQSQRIVEALRRRGAPVAYLEFPGEGHGFRQAETQVRALEAELYFYGRVFGFTPAGDLPAVQIDNLV